MREEEEEEEPNWFARWEEELPSPEELTPLSQTLITPDLALAFDIPTGPTGPHTTIPSHHLPRRPQRPSTPPHLHRDGQTLPQPAHHPPHLQPDFEPPEPRGGGDEPARTLKRPRLVWTPQLHKRFVDAVAQLGIKNAVPKTIMQMMNVDGLTRENVASHLQKYRLYLKRVQQGLSPGAGPVSAADAAADYLFASAPVPHHFLSHGQGGSAVVPRRRVGGGGGSVPGHFMPFAPVVTLQHHQMAAVAVEAAAAAHPQQQQYYPHGHMGHLTRQQQQPGIQRIVGRALDLESDAGVEEGGRKVLTLFPTGDD